jgi:hypothetical protein
MTEPAMADAAADFGILRSRLFGIAYRILGGILDAEDVVQDVWVRRQGKDRARVRDRVAFLVTPDNWRTERSGISPNKAQPGRAGEPAYSRHDWNDADGKRSSEMSDKRR